MKHKSKGNRMQPSNFKRSRRKVEDDQVQLVWHRGRRMRQIMKAGRTIYRPLRKTSKKH
jgi:hypothetical protein